MGADLFSADADASVTNYILFYNPEENARSKYDETFGKFREVVFILFCEPCSFVS